MPTTCRDIVTYALRQAKVLASGEEPSGDEMADGLVALQSVYDGWVANGMFGRLRDSYQATDYTAGEGERVIAPTGVTVEFPTTVDADCGERAPRDLAVIETIVDGARTLKLWDRTGWVSLLDLEESDLAPLASRGAWGLAATLAISGAFVTMFGDGVGPDVRRLALSFQNGLSTKFGSTHDGVTSDYY